MVRATLSKPACARAENPISHGEFQGSFAGLVQCAERAHGGPGDAGVLGAKLLKWHGGDFAVVTAGTSRKITVGKSRNDSLRRHGVENHEDSEQEIVRKGIAGGSAFFGRRPGRSRRQIPLRRRGLQHRPRPGRQRDSRPSAACAPGGRTFNNCGTASAAFPVSISDSPSPCHSPCLAKSANPNPAPAAPRPGGNLWATPRRCRYKQAGSPQGMSRLSG